MIKNGSAVTDQFGYWPEFCDGRILSFALSEGRSIDLSIHYIDSDQSKSAIVNLSFNKVSEIMLTDLMSENIIDLLSISNGVPHEVAIDSCCGLGGSFKCSEVVVRSVIA